MMSTALNGKFNNIGFQALDIGVSQEGDVAVVGIDQKVYVYDFMNDSWDRINTYGIEGITRIDIDDDGTIYIVTKCGVYYLDCENRWIKLQGGATDIAVRDGQVWKIGTDEIKVDTFTNYGVWKLICDCKCLCICRRRCIRFRTRDINPCPPVEDPVYCYWFRVDGYGRNIDILPNGDAVFTALTNIVQAGAGNLGNSTIKTVDSRGNYFRDYECDGNKFLTEEANDITVSNTGIVYVTTLNGRVFKCHRYAVDNWRRVNLDSVSGGANPCSGTILDA